MTTPWVQQISGAVLVLFVLLDVFLTVLYARMGSGIISARLARLVWHAFRVIAEAVPRRRARVLSFCGPVILVLLVLVWMSGLTLGNALILHPAMGTAIRSSGGKTPNDFVSALYAGGSSISIVGSSGFSPHTSRFRLLYLFNSIAGLSVISLTLTYLMQIYSQLQQRNAFALKIYLATQSTGDAAELVTGIMPHGDWTPGTSFLWEMAAETALTKEAHHFYPVLFYMRFPEHYYSVSFVTLVLLDSVTLIRSALSDDYASLKKLRALDQLWNGSLLLLTSLEGTFLPQGAAEAEEPDAEEMSRWEWRLDKALAQFRSAGIATADRADALKAYVASRSQWDGHVRRLAPSMQYPMQDIDPATHGRT
jgi:hypothetical protein